MISKQRLQQAADKGIIQNNQIEPLFDFLGDNTVETTANQEEPLKFIRSFGDVFITFGIGILIFAINMLGLSQYEYLVPIIGFILIAEWLVRVRKLALPGMAILIGILFFVHQAINIGSEQSAIWSFALIAATSLAFYVRYKMPFSLLPLAGALIAIATIMIGESVLSAPIIFSILGLVVFTVAMLFDSQDTKRETHLSDSAFWLHLLASPLIVHGAMLSMLFGDHAWLQVINKEIIIVVFFIVFMLLALMLDRRAMLISTQIYMIYALTQLVQGQFNNSQNLMIYILMVLGVFIIFFGTFWYKTRRLIFGFMSGSTFSRYVPDFKIQDNK
ncbi:MAG: hypothetical protein ACI9V8_000025 [Urechidicola sp.]|jgi:hypothetical protein